MVENFKLNPDLKEAEIYNFRWLQWIITLVLRLNYLNREQNKTIRIKLLQTTDGVVFQWMSQSESSSKVSAGFA